MVTGGHGWSSESSAQSQGVAVAMGCSSSVSEAEVEAPSEPAVPKRKGLKKSLGPFAH